METQITIQIVHGGFILIAPEAEQSTENTNSYANYRTEVFTSQGKLMKALRSAVENHSLVGKAVDAKAEE